MFAVKLSLRSIYVLFAGSEMEGVILLQGQIFVRNEGFSMKCEYINLSHRNLNDSELLPLLQNFRDGKLTRLNRVYLVILSAFNATSLLLCVTRVLQDGNQIGDRGGEMIGEGLKVNRSLRGIHLVRLLFRFVFLLLLWC